MRVYNTIIYYTGEVLSAFSCFTYDSGPTQRRKVSNSPSWIIRELLYFLGLGIGCQHPLGVGGCSVFGEVQGGVLLKLRRRDVGRVDKSLLLSNLS